MSGDIDRRRLLQAAGTAGLATGVTAGVSAREPHEAAVVVGTVTDTADDPVAGASVTLLDGGTEAGSTQTDEAGLYGVGADPESYPKAYQLTVEKDGYNPFSTGVIVESDGEQVTVNVTLDPPAPGAVFGVVTDHTGTPVQDAEISLLTGGTETASTTTSQNGEYSITASPGSYEFHGFKLGFEPATGTVSVEPDQGTSLDLQLSAGPPPMPGALNPPLDHDGDGRFEDIDGNGSFDIFDVQMLFDNLDSHVVTDNPEAFDFSGDGGSVDIFDVQALLERL